MSWTDDLRTDGAMPAILLGAGAGGLGALLFKDTRNHALLFAVFGAASAAVLHGRSKSNLHAAGGYDVTGGGDGGLSFEDAWARAEQKAVIGQQSGPDPIEKIRGELSNAGAAIVSACAPESMSVVIKAAIQNGRAAGVSVYTTPPSPTVSACVASRVRRANFSVSGYMDAVTATF
jgi:hypothetical protein